MDKIAIAIFVREFVTVHAFSASTRTSIYALLDYLKLCRPYIAI